LNDLNNNASIATAYVTTITVAYVTTFLSSKEKWTQLAPFREEGTLTQIKLVR
jgi:hypothetical protein